MPTTQQAILRVIDAHPSGLTIAEMMRHVTMSDSSIRRELLRLEAAGVVYSWRAQDHRRGRPSSRYARAPGRQSAYVEALTASLLGETPSIAAVGSTADFATTTADHQSGSLPKALLAHLAMLGYDAHESSSREDTSASVTRITMRACPLADVVLGTAGERVCHLHEQMIESRCRALGGELVGFIAAHPHARSCEVVVRRRANNVDPAPD